jgi:hypothetical protein
LAPETQADGLGWYGVAPSVLAFAATWTSTPEAHCYPSPEPKEICRGYKVQVCLGLYGTVENHLTLVFITLGEPQAHWDTFKSRALIQSPSFSQPEEAFDGFTPAI